MQYLIFRELEKDFDLQVIHDLLKDQKLEDLDQEALFQLYQLLGDKSFLQRAYDKIQKEVEKLDNEYKEKYLNYPIEKIIITEYNRSNN